MKNEQKYEDFKKLCAEIRATCQELLNGGVKMNELLMEVYKAETGETEFKTFIDWKKEGRIVKKGETSRLIFSRPKSVIKEEKGEQMGDGEKDRFFTCSIFAKNQTEELIK